MMKHLIRSMIFSAALAAGGCVSLLPETAPAKPRYHISSLTADATTGDQVAWTLSVEDPRSSRVYDTVKLAVSPAPGKIQYFAKAEWADRAPRLLQTAIIQSFEDSGRILGVGDRSAMPIGDYALQLDIRKIELNVRGGGQTADADVYVRLSNGRGKIHAAKLFKATTPAQSDDADAVIAAFNQTFDQIIMEMVEWTFANGEAAAVNTGS